MLANNLANIETGGFKADREFFSIYTGDDASADPHTGDIPTLPLVQSHWTDLSQGNLINTANPLDFAIDGDGLFGIETLDGTRYTRNGNFRIASNGVLTAADGSPVRAVGGGGIQLQPGGGVEVLPDGTVQQSGQPVGQLELSSFDRQSIDKMGTNYFAWHGFTEVRLGDCWIKASPTFNSTLCNRFGVTPLDFDGTHDALLQAYDGAGRTFMQYETLHGAFHDVPAKFLMHEMARLYPSLKHSGARSAGGMENELPLASA